jgi:hypothetical protein
MGTVGLILQVVGALVALWGLVRTHDAYAEKTLRSIAGERARTLADRTERTVRRWLRRPMKQTIVLTGIGSGVAVGGYATMTVTWGPLPTRTADALKRLDERTREMNKRIDSLDARLRDLTNEQQETLKRLREDLEQAAREANQLIRHAAIEGLRTEAIGLLLVTVGAMLQGLVWAG